MKFRQIPFALLLYNTVGMNELWSSWPCDLLPLFPENKVQQKELLQVFNYKGMKESGPLL